MQLPSTLRDTLLEALDTYLDAVDEAVCETVVAHIIEQLELTADEHDLDDLPGQIEESASLESSLSDCLDDAFTNGEDFEFTGEMVISAFEELCGIEWVEEAQFVSGQ